MSVYHTPRRCKSSGLARLCWGRGGANSQPSARSGWGRPRSPRAPVLLPSQAAVPRRGTRRLPPPPNFFFFAGLCWCFSLFVQQTHKHANSFSRRKQIRPNHQSPRPARPRVVPSCRAANAVPRGARQRKGLARPSLAWLHRHPQTGSSGPGLGAGVGAAMDRRCGAQRTPRTAMVLAVR